MSKTHLVYGQMMVLEALQQALLKPVQLQMLWNPPQTPMCKTEQYYHNATILNWMEQYT